MNCTPYKISLDPVTTENKCGVLMWKNLINSFDTKRIFLVTNCGDLDKHNKFRGLHSNPEFNELIIMSSGQIHICLTYATNHYEYICDPGDCVFIPKKYYMTIEIKNKNTQYTVLCDEML